MTRTLTSLAAVLAMSIAAFAAGPAKAAEPTHEEIARNAAKTLGIQARLDSITPSEDLKGFIEVRIGSQLLYLTGDGKKLVEGQVIDISSKRNLTQMRLNDALAIDFDKLPLNDALITHKDGTGKHRIAVFADPHCGYCKRFEPVLGEMKDATVYTFIIPVLGQRSDDFSKRILCSAQPAAAWRDWMTKGIEPVAASASCSAEQFGQLARNKAFAAAHSINSTPTTFVASRMRLPGAMTPEQLRAALATASTAAATSAAAQPKGKPQPAQALTVADRR